MARRETFNDPLSGRFISRAEAFEGDAVWRTYIDGKLTSERLIQDGEVVSLTETVTAPNWTEWPTDRSMQWRSGDDPLSLGALADADFPDDAVSFRVVYRVQYNPEYPQGYSGSIWLDPDKWPPTLDMSDTDGVVGIERIYFDRS